MEYVTLDKSGRMIMPKKIRQEFETNVFEVNIEKSKIVLKPTAGLAGLFGVAPELNVNEYLKEKKEAARRENSS